MDGFGTYLKQKYSIVQDASAKVEEEIVENA